MNATETMPNAAPIIAEFETKHGRSIFDKDRQCFLYEDGACRDQNPMGVLMPPPHDKADRAKAVMRFWQIATAQAEELFIEQKEHFQSGGQTVMEKSDADHVELVRGPEDMRKALNKIKVRVHKLRQKLKAAQEYADEVTPKPPVMPTPKDMAAEAGIDGINI